MTSTNSIGVPGIPAMLDQAHKKYGQLNWKKLFEYPIQLAEKGFKITPRFYALVKRDMFLMKHRESREYFYTKLCLVENDKLFLNLFKIKVLIIDKIY